MIKKSILLAAIVATQPACIEAVAAAVLLGTDTDVDRPPSKFERDECERLLAAPVVAVPGCVECGSEGGEADSRHAACVRLFERHETWRTRN